eukprot:g40512.t1
MTNTRVLKQVLYSQLRNSRQAPGGQRKQFRDTFKASLVNCGITTGTEESLAHGRPKLRRSMREVIEHLETCRQEIAAAGFVDCFVEHLCSVRDKRQHLPVVNHFNSPSHSLGDMSILGLLQCHSDATQKLE